MEEARRGCETPTAKNWELRDSAPIPGRGSEEEECGAEMVALGRDKAESCRTEIDSRSWQTGDLGCGLHSAADSLDDR